MTKITDRSGTQDFKGTESPANINTIFIDYLKDSEKVNGRLAKIGLVALCGAYTITGQIIPGIS